MSYQALARRWRPATFADTVGQEHVRRPLGHALEQQRLHHAYLFTGSRGTGKTSIARIFAACLNCERGIVAEPCGECAACREIRAGHCVDFIEVDAASRTGVEHMRNLLDNVSYAPMQRPFKVYLIDEVHMLSEASFNALLKTLEEPPEHVKFLFATTEAQRIPATVASRCIQFHLRRLSVVQIEEHLRHILRQEKLRFEEEALGHLARAATGSMRDALSLTEQALAAGAGALRDEEVRHLLGVVGRSQLYAVLETLAAGDGARLLQLVEEIGGSLAEYDMLLRELLELLHQTALLQVIPELRPKTGEKDEQLSELAQRLSPEDVQLFYQIGLLGQRDMELMPDTRSGLEMVLLRMLAFRPQQVEAPRRGTGAAATDRSQATKNAARVAGEPARQAAARTDTTDTAAAKAPPEKAPANGASQTATQGASQGATQDKDALPTARPARPTPAAAEEGDMVQLLQEEFGGQVLREPAEAARHGTEKEQQL